ncbi:MAG: AtpZ/AtpI family protein [Desulforegulaceae bacterium]|nr:AtpZ/AtpI family protein [Desulforegulaceae bacterium]
MKWFKEISLFGSVGLSFALSIFIGLFFGIWLDKVFSLSPICTFAGLFLGICAGYNGIIKLIKRINKL